MNSCKTHYQKPDLRQKMPDIGVMVTYANLKNS